MEATQALDFSDDDLDDLDDDSEFLVTQRQKFLHFFFRCNISRIFPTFDAFSFCVAEA